MADTRLIPPGEHALTAVQFRALAEVQEWLGHVNISTTRMYDHRRRRPEESPTFRVRY